MILRADMRQSGRVSRSAWQAFSSVVVVAVPGCLLGAVAEFD
jgi:hypothetical protein